MNNIAQHLSVRSHTTHIVTFLFTYVFYCVYGDQSSSRVQECICVYAHVSKYQHLVMKVLYKKRGSMFEHLCC